MSPKDEAGDSTSMSEVRPGQDCDQQSPVAIDIQKIVRLRERQKWGLDISQGVMGFGVLAVMLWLGGRAAVALIIVYVILSILNNFSFKEGIS